MSDPKYDPTWTVELTQLELKLLSIAAMREMEYFHSGELKKRNDLMRVYRKLLEQIQNVPVVLREDENRDGVTQ